MLKTSSHLKVDLSTILTAQVFVVSDHAYACMGCGRQPSREAGLVNEWAGNAVVAASRLLCAGECSQLSGHPPAHSTSAGTQSVVEVLVTFKLPYTLWCYG